MPGTMRTIAIGVFNAPRRASLRFLNHCIGLGSGMLSGAIETDVPAFSRLVRGASLPAVGVAQAEAAQPVGD